MMNNKALDSFSWNRCIGMWKMYGRAIGRQLLLYTGLCVSVYLFMVLLVSVNSSLDPVPIYGFLSIIVAYAVYLSPLVFSGRDDTLMAQLPVTPAEKTVFYLGYSTVFMFAFTNIFWHLLIWAGGLIFSVGNIDTLVTNKAYALTGNLMMSPELKFLTHVSNFLQSAFTTLLCAYIVFTKRSYVFLNSFLMPVLYLFVIGSVSGIVGAVVGFGKVINDDNFDPKDVESVEAMTADIMDGMMPVIVGLSILTVVGAVIVTVVLYRKFKHPRVLR